MSKSSHRLELGENLLVLLLYRCVCGAVVVGAVAGEEVARIPEVLAAAEALGIVKFL
jgi:hypothetical protein